MSLSAPISKNVASVRVLDACGAVLSGLCAVHCALTPLLITALPALASHGVETSFRRCLVFVGIVGVGLGAWVHRSRDALWPLGGAVLLATLFELHVISMAWEVFPSLALSALLITAHAQNSKACHQKLECCPNEHGAAPYWGDFTAQAPSGRKNANTAIVALSAAVLVHAVVIAVAVHFGVGPTSLAPSVHTTEIELEAPPPVVEKVAPAMAQQAPVALPVSSTAPQPAAAQPMPAAAPAAPAEAPVAFERALGAPSADASPVPFKQTFGGTGAPGASSRSGAGVGNAAANAPALPAPAMQGPVDAAQLSRRPVQPPGLSSRIEAHYPAAARSQQLTGRGSARALVSPDGTVVAVTPGAETPVNTGFAAACANALRGSSGWGTPLDAQGRAVSTWIRFSCEFGIRY
jgi:hypothetical protein